MKEHYEHAEAMNILGAYNDLDTWLDDRSKHVLQTCCPDFNPKHCYYKSTSVAQEVVRIVYEERTCSCCSGDYCSFEVPANLYFLPAHRLELALPEFLRSLEAKAEEEKRHAEQQRERDNLRKLQEAQEGERRLYEQLRAKYESTD